MGKKQLVAEKRNYLVTTCQQAKDIAHAHLSISTDFGMPKIVDETNEWRVPILSGSITLGNLFVNAYTGEINPERSTKVEMMEKRLQSPTLPLDKGDVNVYTISPLQNTIICGDALTELKRMPDNSVDLVFTSPPYYNARPQYEEYTNYESYLATIRAVIKEVKRVLVDGRFFVMNVSHVLVPRNQRNESSQRIAVPFDIHQIFAREGYEFIDDIIWQKPEGAGWASGRGRRFAADRHPLQYKAVPTTEYVLVYRSKSSKLIDWFIRNHPDQECVKDSKIGDYEKTNVWYISPSRSKLHPATFPIELADKVIRYYSFKNDVVLDPFAGIGTVGIAAAATDRRYCLIEKEHKYVNEIKIAER